MATTWPIRTEAVGMLKPGGGGPSRSSTSRRWRLVPAAAVSSMALSSGLAVAQQPALSVRLDSLLTWTSNADLAVGAGSDLILDVRPRIDVRSEGARLRVNGYAALDAVAYARDTQPNRVLPEVDLAARLEAVERLFYLEAGVRATRTSVDAFGVRPDSTSTRNALTTAQYRMVPSLEKEFGDGGRVRVRSENVRTREYGVNLPSTTTSAGGSFGRHTLLAEQGPRPWGWRFEAERSETRYDDATGDATLDLLRASLDYAVNEALSAGARVGRERNDFAGPAQWRNIYGAEIDWRPSPRTTLSAFQERRFFGSGWNLSFSHRMPVLALNAAFTRGVDTTPQALLDLPPTENVPALLDAMLTTRFPDPGERARLVRDLMARQGLPVSTLAPVSLYSRRLSIVSTGRAGLALNGARNSLAFSAYRTRTEDAVDSGPLSSGAAVDNNVQHGFSVVLTHRFTPQWAGSAGAEWSRITGLATADSSESREIGARVQLTAQVAPKTQVLLGTRYRKLQSTVSASGREGSVFVGLNHGF